jgi:hypothetical protein
MCDSLSSATPVQSLIKSSIATGDSPGLARLAKLFFRPCTPNWIITNAEAMVLAPGMRIPSTPVSRTKPCTRLDSGSVSNICIDHPSNEYAVPSPMNTRNSRKSL